MLTLDLHRVDLPLTHLSLTPPEHSVLLHLTHSIHSNTHTQPSQHPEHPALGKRKSVTVVKCISPRKIYIWLFCKATKG